MKLFWIGLIFLWTLIIIDPDLVGIIIWIVMITIWLNIFLINSAFNKWNKNSIKFWWYEIFKNKK